MTQEQAQGKLDQAKGQVKEEVGKVAGDRSTETSGKIDQAKGKVEEGIGNMKQEVDRQIDSH
jgi:uncharacterized protein YjbJ (UPF0337 family)